MIPHIRQQYNQAFTEEKYQAFTADLSAYGIEPKFRTSETPVFIPKYLSDKLVEASEQLVDIFINPDFKAKTASATPTKFRVPNETDYPDFISIDFAICQNEKGELYPQLIEMQGFPTLVYYLDVTAHRFRKHFDISDKLTHYFSGLNQESYHDLVGKVILGNQPKENVVLVEVDPDNQKTQIDFLFTKKILGIETVCLSKLKKSGREVYYEKEGKKIPVHRIYNRLIFDDIEKRSDFLKDAVDIREDLNVEWVSHPNWFFRISKYTLPLLDTPYVPASQFLDKNNLPDDLSKYVLKPLHSFAGQGVILDVKPSDIEAVNDPLNYVLQKKIEYASVVDTPVGKRKCEIRMLYAWEAGKDRPTLVINLARMSEGMIGVNYNKATRWSGGTVAFFEK